jgi:L-fuconolactonase
MMRIDAHQHFWDLQKLSYPWMPKGSILERNFLPEDLKPKYERNRFDGSVVVQATTQMEEAWWLLELAREHWFIKGVVAWVDLTSPELPKALDALQRQPRFAGVRHPVHDEPDDRWLLRDAVIEGLRELARRDVPYDLLLRPQHLPILPELADRVPGLRMVIDHIAKPRIAEQVFEPWAYDMARAAEIPGIHVKLSGMITEARIPGWTAEDLKPYVKHVMSLFPPERLMYGSDWPVCLLAGSYKATLAAFTQSIGAQPEAVRNEILGGTAVRFYGLKE